jgi:hypothetical protein
MKSGSKSKKKSLALSSINSVGRELVVLRRTRSIDKQDLELPEWEQMQFEYDSCQGESWVNRAIVSLLNSLIFQRRVFFILSRGAFRRLLNEDKNWKKQIGLKNDNWTVFLRTAKDRGIIKERYVSSTKAHVYELIHSEMLNIVKINVGQQFEEAVKFSECMDNFEGTDEGTNEGDIDPVPVPVPVPDSVADPVPVPVSASVQVSEKTLGLDSTPIWVKKPNLNRHENFDKLDALRASKASSSKTKEIETPLPSSTAVTATMTPEEQAEWEREGRPKAKSIKDLPSEIRESFIAFRDKVTSPDRSTGILKS